MFRSAGALCQVLPFARAYHTPLFEPVSERLFELLQTLELRPAAVPTYSCVTADLYPEDPQEIRKLAAAQWSRPVRFRETVERMYKDGIRIFVEVGPSSNLTAFVEDILRGRASVAIPSDIAGRSGMIQIQHVAAQLFACGVPFAWMNSMVTGNPNKFLWNPMEDRKAVHPLRGCPICLCGCRDTSTFSTYQCDCAEDEAFIASLTITTLHLERPCSINGGRS